MIPVCMGFQSTPPVRGATHEVGATAHGSLISIHAPRAGSDVRHSNRLFAFQEFQSTPPVRGATSSTCLTITAAANFNPRPPCGERRGGTDLQRLGVVISIHAPRAGSDVVVDLGADTFLYFNPRPPCGERRAPAALSWPRCIISIHAPRAGSDQAPGQGQYLAGISIHAPRAGSDPSVPICIYIPPNFNPRPPCGERPLAGCTPIITIKGFQSTPPVRGATGGCLGWHQGSAISIHAPRAGSDHTCGCQQLLGTCYFNPRPPCGERPSIHIAISLTATNFNPRPPCGERRGWHLPGNPGNRISIHAPRAGSDCNKSCRSWTASHFNPRPPCGERQ